MRTSGDPAPGKPGCCCCTALLRCPSAVSPVCCNVSVFLNRAISLQAMTRTSMALSAARGGGMRWTWAGAWAPCAAYLCSRCAAEAARRNVRVQTHVMKKHYCGCRHTKVLAASPGKGSAMPCLLRLCYCSAKLGYSIQRALALCALCLLLCCLYCQHAICVSAQWVKAEFVAWRTSKGACGRWSPACRTWAAGGTWTALR